MRLTCTAASIDIGTSMALAAASSATPTTTSITRLLALHQPTCNQSAPPHAPQLAHSGRGGGACMVSRGDARGLHLRRANSERWRWSRRQWPRMMTGAKSSRGISS